MNAICFSNIFGRSDIYYFGIIFGLLALSRQWGFLFILSLLIFSFSMKYFYNDDIFKKLFKLLFWSLLIAFIIGLIIVLMARFTAYWFVGVSMLVLYLAGVYGAFYLVVVDYDKDSPTYLEWDSFTLDDKNCKSVLVPPGFLNGHFLNNHQL